jgi:Putative secretion activating protein
MKPDFPTAYAFTMAHEIGPHSKSMGYSVDPDDPGGETIAGISRRYHMSWTGWKIVDEKKRAPGFPGNLNCDSLDSLISQFYLQNFWNPARCADMPSHAIAAEIFDTAVNMGVPRAGLFLQKAVNKLNRNGTAYQDIAEDGFIGDKTIAAVGMCLCVNPLGRLLTVMNIYQGEHYLRRMTEEPTQEKWVGWFDRVHLTHKYP